MDEIRLRIRPDEKLASKLLETRGRIEAIGSHPEVEKRIEAQQSAVLTRWEIAQYVRFILMTDHEFDAWVTSYRSSESYCDRLW